jgi:hypothetical protein
VGFGDLILGEKGEFFEKEGESSPNLSTQL